MHNPSIMLLKLHFTPYRIIKEIKRVELTTLEGLPSANLQVFVKKGIALGKLLKYKDAILHSFLLFIFGYLSIYCRVITFFNLTNCCLFQIRYYICLNL